MEVWDIYDKYRQKTGRVHKRGNSMPNGDYHLVIHIWIVNDKGEFLIQKGNHGKKVGQICGIVLWLVLQY